MDITDINIDDIRSKLSELLEYEERNDYFTMTSAERRTFQQSVHEIIDIAEKEQTSPYQTNMEKHFVRFYYPGAIISDTDDYPIRAWDVNDAILIIEQKEYKPYAFMFFTRSRCGEDLDSHISKTSGTYYINGIVKTLEQVKSENDPNNYILIRNMECNGWNKIVTTTSQKYAQPFFDTDQIIQI